MFGSSESDEKYEAKYDLNGDGEIGFSDFVIFAQNFGKEVPSPVVAIPDANLRAAFEAALGKASGVPITRAEMATLDSLTATKKGISDLTGLEFATNLTWLNLASNNITDITPLAGLTELREVFLQSNNISDLASLVGNTGLGKGGKVDVANNPLNAASLSTHIPALQAKGVGVSYVPSPAVSIPDANLRAAFEAALDKAIGAPVTRAEMATLDSLEANDADISDLTGLEFATNLTYLSLYDNNITDISALAGLTNLTVLILESNHISDLAPLAENTGLGTGDTVSLNLNPLNVASTSTHIPALQAKGVSVSIDEKIVIFTEPQIYKDNVFVLPVSEDLAGGNLPYWDYAARFYKHFNDEFDFLTFVSNVKEKGSLWPFAAHIGVRNDVLGIGLDIFFDERWGSAERLQSVIFFSYGGVGGYYDPKGEYWSSGFGTLIHELMHRWANYIVPPYGHWGFNSQRGWLGGPLGEFIDLGDGKFSIGRWPTRLPLYSPIELYLAGFIPPDDVPDLTIAEDGKFLLDEEGEWVMDDDANVIITASRIKTYTIEDIIAEHGPRVPDHSQPQKDFRAAVILLVSEEYPVDPVDLAVLSYEVSYNSRQDEGAYVAYDKGMYPNFFVATGGRGTITMDGLSQFQRSAGAKISVPRSFGTPPPPIVDHRD